MTTVQDILHALIAQQAPEGAPGCAAAGSFVPILLMIVIIYFLMIRPQQKTQKKHQEMLGALKKGDRVVTQGGLIGIVYAVTDREVTLELARDVRVRVVKGQIAAQFTEQAEAVPETK